MHPVEREELMAYLDGELPVGRAAAVAAHAEQCAECRALAADFRRVSERLSTWQVEPAAARLAERVDMSAQKHFEEPKARKAQIPNLAPLALPRPLIPRWVWAVAGTFVLLLLVVAVSIPNLLRSKIASNQVSPDNSPYLAPRAVSPQTRGYGGGGAYAPQLPASPMIVRTASLALVSKEFDQTRAAIEAAVRQHGGYTAQLAVAGQAGAGRSLTATFRVPAEQLDAVMAELKKLGRVEQESQSGEEVTQQYVDLSARLANARRTEQRLGQVLEQRTGRIPDVLAVEREIARVREEIERLEAQLKNLDKQVEFASLQVRLSEEYKAQIEVTPPSTSTRLRNATVEGYHSLVENALGLMTFLLSYGPVLLFWGAILYWPARFAWRRLRASQ
jgi:anti-sigma factor RsiW